MSLRFKTFRSYQDDLGGSEARNNKDSRDISIVVRFSGKNVWHIQISRPYQTRLGLAPGPPTDSDGKFIPVAEWDESSWPSHIHAPRHNMARTKV